ncbi:MAG TPA: hypothetical protein VGV08_11885 [Casimicrobiaceae bacterium]|nr:hypothetical protein [Casimicrobiaceae bacterium]
MLIAETSESQAAIPRDVAAMGGECYAEVDGPRCIALLPDTGHAPPSWKPTRARMLFAGGRYGGDAGDWLFRVGLWVPTSHRAELLAWYEQEHLPILLDYPSWEGCRFVEVRIATGLQFIALHQLAEREALNSPSRARSRDTPWFHRLKQHAWFDQAFTRVLYRRPTAP